MAVQCFTKNLKTKRSECLVTQRTLLKECPTDFNQTREPLGSLRISTLRFLSRSQHREGIIPEDLWIWFSSNRIKPSEIYLRPISFFRKFYSRNIASLGWKSQREYKMKGDCCQKQADKSTQLQTSAAFYEKGRVIKRMELRATQDCSQVLKAD